VAGRYAVNTEVFVVPPLGGFFRACQCENHASKARLKGNYEQFGVNQASERVGERRKTGGESEGYVWI